MAEHNGPIDSENDKAELYEEFDFGATRPEDSDSVGFKLPHWTDPPTGEIPRVLADLDGDNPSIKSRLSSSRFASFFASEDQREPQTEDSFAGVVDAEDEHFLSRREIRNRKPTKPPAIDKARLDGFGKLLVSSSLERKSEPISGPPELGLKKSASGSDGLFGAPAEMKIPSRRINIAIPKLVVPRKRRNEDSKFRVTPVFDESELNQSEKDDAASGFAPSTFSGRRERLRSARSESGAGKITHKKGLSFTRILTGLGLGAVVLLGLHFGPLSALFIVAVAILLAVIEFYDTVRRAGFRPATLLGLAAVLSLLVTTYTKGANGAPLVFAFLVIASMLWYLTGVIRGEATINISITFLGVIWIGGLGSFAAAILRPQDFPHSHGVAFLLGIIIATVANDTVAYFFGSWFGRHKMVPQISPTKSWEGLIAGSVASVLVSALVVSQISPWTVSSALILGIVVAIVAPLGDLSESMIKRDLHIKDMGKLLPGHGGMLDRIDGLLFVLPAVYYLLKVLHLS